MHINMLCPPPGSLQAPHHSQSPARPVLRTPPPPVRPLLPPPGPRPLRCHRGIPPGPLPPPDDFRPRIWDCRYSVGRKRNNGDGSSSQTWMRVTPRHKGSGKNSLLNGEVTGLTNQGDVKWGGRRRHELLLADLPISLGFLLVFCRHSPLLRERLRRHRPYAPY